MKKVKRVSTVPTLPDRASDAEEFENYCFVHADKYRVTVYQGGGKKETLDFATFPEAMMTASKLKNVVVYASTREGFGVPLVEKKWPHFLDLYNRESGQRLRFPDGFWEARERLLKGF
jgi:hypothetical protein